MSWDISIFDLPKDAAAISDIPDDFKPSPLGSRADIIARVLRVVPDVDFSDPSWGMLHRDTFSIEFNMGSSEECDSIMLHVRGGDDVVSLISELLTGMELRALDCQTGEFFEPMSATQSIEEWRAFRDRVIEES